MRGQVAKPSRNRLQHFSFPEFVAAYDPGDEIKYPFVITSLQVYEHLMPYLTHTCLVLLTAKDPSEILTAQQATLAAENDIGILSSRYFNDLAAEKQRKLLEPPHNPDES